MLYFLVIHYEHARLGKIKKKAKRESFHPYTKITPRFFKRFEDCTSEDMTNITMTSRSVEDYEKRLGIESLENMIVKRAKETGEKVILLDSGCGEANAIDELLSNPRLTHVLGSCVGISLHYFDNVKAVMEKHGSRFTYYRGKVQEVLKEYSQHFDFIVDVFGAYTYCEDKLQLCKLFHNALKPHGVAEIYVGANMMEKSIILKDENENLSGWSKMCKQYPETFTQRDVSVLNSIAPRPSVIELCKATQRFPSSPYFLQGYSVKSLAANASPLSIEKMAKGNSIAPISTLYNPSLQSPPTLRPLAFKP